MTRRRKIETYTQVSNPVPGYPAATPAVMKCASHLICRRVSDPWQPDDVATATEFRGTCRDCGEPVFYRLLPNPNVELICIECWNELKASELTHGRH